MCVPLSSPRVTNGAWAAAIRASAAAASFIPATPAGSDSGPTITKSLYAISTRELTSPFSTSSCSDAGAWTSSTSATPCRPISSAAPVPTAMILTSTSYSASKIGASTSSRPLSLRLVVVARISVPGSSAPGGSSLQAANCNTAQTANRHTAI